MKLRMRVCSDARVTDACVVLYLAAMLKARQRENGPKACLGGGGCKAPAWFKPKDPDVENECDDDTQKQPSTGDS